VPVKAGRLAIGVLKPGVFVLCCLPLANGIWDGYTGGLGVNPVEAITHRTGDWALRLLLATLAVTPMRHLTGWQPLGRVRRMLGLFAFFYACLHMLVYFVLDAGLSLAWLLDDVLKRPYVTAGFTAFCLLLPLALTSTDAMVRRLGGRRWRSLHRLVYPAAGAAVLHFLWLVKADLSEPLLYLAILAVLLALRLPPIVAGLRAMRVGMSGLIHGRGGGPPGPEPRAAKRE
jgi:methionine sulfoxide reductase heme-binding subunit